MKGKVVGAKHDVDNGRLLGAQLENGLLIEGDALLYACGPWTASVLKGTKAHSVVVPSSKTLLETVFVTNDKEIEDFEGFARPDGTVSLFRLHSRSEPIKEEPILKELNRLTAAIRRVASDLVAMEGQQLRKRCCYEPRTPDGWPIMSKLQDQPQCHVAAGHSCWGIALGPATGETMANLIVTGRPSTDHVNLHMFNPHRFGKLSIVPNL